MHIGMIECAVNIIETMGFLKRKKLFNYIGELLQIIKELTFSSRYLRQLLNNFGLDRSKN